MNIPIISPVGGSGAVINSRYTRLYNNPHFDYLSEMLPKDIKELFKWCEIAYQSTPVVANGIRKLINYPVTDFTYTSDSESVRTMTRNLVTSLKLKSVLLEFGNDYYVYGNVFRSVYLPFKRMLKCDHCGHEVAVVNADFKVVRQDIHIKCPTCNAERKASIHDIATNDINRIKIVRWDPKQIELQQNQITGNINYYYNLPKQFVASVRRGDLTVFADTPEMFIRAALKGRNLHMGNNFYHAKTTGLSGYSSGWGISPLMSTLKNYMYIAVLRRASEAIGMEHITPQRILFPQGTGSSDPCVMTSMSRWRDEMRTAIERWRMDANYVMLAPYPTGVANIGSQGRQLIPTEEIKDARMEMALALDIPPGIIMGDTNIQNSAVGLRILENQLTPYVEQLNDFANWVIDSINAHTGRSYSPVGLVPFKLADDMMTKQILLSSVGNLVSKTTVQEALNIDPDKEAQRIIEDQISEHEMQSTLEKKITEKEQSAVAVAQNEAAEQSTGMPSHYNQQKMIAMAQEQAMQLLGMPYEQRKSVLAQLQNEDYVMWALVSKQLEAIRAQQGSAAQQGE